MLTEGGSGGSWSNGKPSINGAQVTHQIRRASGRGRGHLSWDPLNRACCGWEVGWVGFLAEGTALAKALKQERAQVSGD